MKGIIFDLDGVIVSTDEQHYLGWKALADRLGIPFSREVNNRFRGVSRMACMDILEEIGRRHFTEEEKTAYANWKNDYYRALLARMSPADLSGEVRSILDALRARGLQLAIGSSSKNARFILQRIGLEGYFDAVSGVEAAHAGGMKAAAVGDAAAKGCGDTLLTRFSDLLDFVF